MRHTEPHWWLNYSANFVEWLAHQRRSPPVRAVNQTPGLARTINVEMIERSHCVYFADDSFKDFVSPKLAAKTARQSKT